MQLEKQVRPERRRPKRRGRRQWRQQVSWWVDSRKEAVVVVVTVTMTGMGSANDRFPREGEDVIVTRTSNLSSLADDD
jgi:hypothetical protein